MKKTSTGSGGGGGGGGGGTAVTQPSHASSDLLKPPARSHRIASPSKSASGHSSPQQGGDSVNGNGRVSPMLKVEHGSNGSFTQDQPLGEYFASSFRTAEGSAASDYGMDESDSVDGLFSAFSKSSLSPSDPQKIKQLTSELRSKIMDTMESIKLAQEKKEENVYKYLSDAARDDPHSSATKSKAAFEKQNQKSGQKIALLQHKLEKYRKRIELLEAGIVPDKQHHALDVLRDVGQGLKDVGANIRDGLSGISGAAADHTHKRGRGISESQRSRDGRKGFGSADNITGVQTEGDSAHKDGKPQPHTMPAGFKYHSDEDIPAALQHGHEQAAKAALGGGLVTGEGTDIAPRLDANLIMSHLENNRKLQESLLEGMEAYRIQTNEQLDLLRRELDIHKQRVEELESHIMEFSDSRRSDSDSFRQDLARLEERGDYRLEERVRDMQDMLDNCRNRIAKMETQSSSLDLMEATNYSLIVTKLINVALALLAVVFVLISATASLVRPLYATRGRAVVTCCLLVGLFALWQLWPHLFAPQVQSKERRLEL